MCGAALRHHDAAPPLNYRSGSPVEPDAAGGITGDGSGPLLVAVANNGRGKGEEVYGALASLLAARQQVAEVLHTYIHKKKIHLPGLSRCAMTCIFDVVARAGGWGV